MLSPAVLAVARRGAFNMHGSLLPKLPRPGARQLGDHPRRARDRGDSPRDGREARRRAHRRPGGRAHRRQRHGRGSLRPGDAGGGPRPRAAPCRPSSTAPPTLRPQDLASGSYFGGRKPEDGRIDWTRSAREVHDLVRAVAPPYPGAFTSLGGHRVRVLRTWWSDPPPLAAAAPGTIAAAGGRAWACCGDGRWLELREARDRGRRRAGRAGARRAFCPRRRRHGTIHLRLSRRARPLRKSTP